MPYFHPSLPGVCLHAGAVQRQADGPVREAGQRGPGTGQTSGDQKEQEGGGVRPRS